MDFKEGLKLDVFFQPIVYLNSQEVIGFEALLRGFDKNGKTIYPKQIFETLNQKEREKIDIVSFELALSKAKKAELYKKHLLFVNVSCALPDDVISLLRSSNYPKNRLVIEICENMPEGKFEAFLIAFSEEDISFALDDFGFKLSNLDRLLNLQNCNWLKIDKSLTQNTAFLSLFSYASRKLGYNVVIERVEDQKDLPPSTTKKNFFAQGFLFGKPSPLFVT